LAAQNPPLNAQKSLQDWPVLTIEDINDSTEVGPGVFGGFNRYIWRKLDETLANREFSQPFHFAANLHISW